METAREMRIRLPIDDAHLVEFRQLAEQMGTDDETLLLSLLLACTCILFLFFDVFRFIVKATFIVLLVIFLGRIYQVKE